MIADSPDACYNFSVVDYDKPINVRRFVLDRTSIFDYANRTYRSIPEYLWKRQPDYAVLRHIDNKKWYAIIMNIEKDKLGLNSTEKVDIINLKCEPEIIGSLQMTKGIFAGYHMNKKYWISVLLDGSINENMLYDLLDMSFQLTGNKKRG